MKPVGPAKNSWMKNEFYRPMVIDDQGRHYDDDGQIHYENPQDRWVDGAEKEWATKRKLDRNFRRAMKDTEHREFAGPEYRARYNHLHKILDKPDIDEGFRGDLIKNEKSTNENISEAEYKPGKPYRKKYSDRIEYYLDGPAGCYMEKWIKRMVGE